MRAAIDLLLCRANSEETDKYTSAIAVLKAAERVDREAALQFIREIDADYFVQYPEGPNESEILKAERKRMAAMFSCIRALLESLPEKT